MIHPQMHTTEIERVTEIYVAVFPVPVNAKQSIEVVLAGYQKHPDMPNMGQIRATIETDPAAVENLVALCDRIVDEQEQINSYRLLKFDKDGIHVLRSDDFRTFAHRFADARWGYC